MQLKNVKEELNKNNWFDCRLCWQSHYEMTEYCLPYTKKSIAGWTVSLINKVLKIHLCMEKLKFYYPSDFHTMFKINYNI